MTPRVRRCVQLAGLVLLGLAVVVGWASAAEARPEQERDEIRCPGQPAGDQSDRCTRVTIDCDARNIFQKVWDGVRAQSHDGSHDLVVPGTDLRRGSDAEENDRRHEWGWYVEEATEEAKNDNCTLALNSTYPWDTCDNRPADPGAGANFPLPEGCWGPHPTVNYNITYDGGDWNDVGTKLRGAITDWTFSLGRSVLQVGLWLVGNSFSFDIREYTSFSDGLARNYETRLIDEPLTDSSPWTIEDVVWFVLISFAGITALRGKVGVAGGEIALSIVVAALALVLVDNRPGFMNTTADLIDDTSSALLLAGTGNDPSASEATIEQAARELQGGIHQEFVAGPYDWINWGGPANLSHSLCQRARDRIVQAGLSDDDGWSRRYMAEQENEQGHPVCAAAASANEEPTTERMMGSLLTAAIAIWVALVIGLTALTVIISKFAVALLFALVPFAAVAAALPSTGRRMAWMWLGTLVQAIFAVAGSSLVLTFLMLGVKVVRETVPSTQPQERWLVVLLIIAVVYMARRRLLSTSQQAATSVTDNLTRLSPASNWQGGIPAGMNLDGMDRAVSSKIGAGSKLVAGGAAVAAGGALAGLGRTVQTRLAERRQARRSLNNLETMERRREGPYLEYKHDPTPKPSASVRVRTAAAGGGGGGGGGAAHAGGGGGGGRGRLAPGAGRATAGARGRATGGHGRARHHSGGTAGGGMGGAGGYAGSSHGGGPVGGGGYGGGWSGSPGGGADGAGGAFGAGGGAGGGFGGAAVDVDVGGGGPGRGPINPVVSMKFRAPRSYRPAVSDIWRPSQWGGRQLNAATDRFRLRRKQKQFQRITGRKLPKYRH